jgi:hypothetical protein
LIGVTIASFLTQQLRQLGDIRDDQSHERGRLDWLRIAEYCFKRRYPASLAMLARTGEAMVTAEDCRQLAIECQRWANQAESEITREIFLQMSRELTAAATRADGLLLPLPESPDTILERQIADIRSLYRQSNKAT